MGATDDKTKFNAQTKELKLPDGLRFIATINNDRTTEHHPTDFDRSPVIKLESADETLFNIENKQFNEEYNQYSFDDIKNLFSTPDETVTFSDNEKEIIRTLRQDHNILNIENRKIRAIRNFTVTGRELFQESRTDEINDLRALDEAILIHVLPKLQGQGVDYRDKLNNLRDYLERCNMLNSLATVEKIIASSKLNNFSFSRDNIL